MAGVVALMMTAAVRSAGKLVEECVVYPIGGIMTQFLWTFGVESAVLLLEAAIVSGGASLPSGVPPLTSPCNSGERAQIPSQ